MTALKAANEEWVLRECVHERRLRKQKELCLHTETRVGRWQRETAQNDNEITEESISREWLFMYLVFCFIADFWFFRIKRKSAHNWTIKLAHSLHCDVYLSLTVCLAWRVCILSRNFAFDFIFTYSMLLSILLAEMIKWDWYLSQWNKHKQSNTLCIMHLDSYWLLCDRVGLCRLEYVAVCVCLAMHVYLFIVQTTEYII